MIRLARSIPSVLAVSLALAGAAQAQTPSSDMRAQAMALYGVCHANVSRLCAGVKPGGGRIIACLKAHAPGVSPDCRSGLFKAKAARDKAAEAGALPR